MIPLESANLAFNHGSGGFRQYCFFRPAARSGSSSGPVHDFEDGEFGTGISAMIDARSPTESETGCNCETVYPMLRRNRLLKENRCR